MIQKICHLFEAGKPFVLATIISLSGSTPRTAGGPDDHPGGRHHRRYHRGRPRGGAVMAAAPDILCSGRFEIRSFDLGRSGASGEMDMICGGRAGIVLMSGSRRNRR